MEPKSEKQRKHERIFEELPNYMGEDEVQLGGMVVFPTEYRYEVVEEQRS